MLTDIHFLQEAFKALEEPAKYAPDDLKAAAAYIQRFGAQEDRERLSLLLSRIPSLLGKIGIYSTVALR